MIINHMGDASDNGSLVLRQNESLSWRGNQIFLCILSLYMLVLSVSWVQAGAWWIIPFSGFEVLCAWVGIYLLKRHQQYREQILFTEQTLTIRKGRDQAEQEICYPRHAVRLRVVKSHEWYATRLYLQYLNQRLEIAKDLSEQDKMDLVRLIKPLLVHV